MIRPRYGTVGGKIEVSDRQSTTWRDFKEEVRDLDRNCDIGIRDFLATEPWSK